MPDTERSDRLRKAREARGYATATVAAEALGIPYGTYSGYENGHRDIPRDVIPVLAAKYRVSTSWLLNNEGPMKPTTIPIVGVVGADPGGAILYSEVQGELGETPMMPGTDERTVAVEVRGESMRDIADHGSLVYYREHRSPPTDDLVGRVCVVGLEDGRVLIKKLLRGTRPKHFDLVSIVGETLLNQRVQWAAPVLTTVSSYLAAKIVERPA